MSRRGAAWRLVLAAGLLLTGTARAADRAAPADGNDGAVMLVEGRIVSVEPVRQPDRDGPAMDCRPTPPAEDLVALLGWDLRAGCPPGAAVAGYRVSYQWDGRTYQRVMDQPPRGDTVSLRVRLR